jgi:hypothetical protein
MRDDVQGSAQQDGSEQVGSRMGRIGSGWNGMKRGVAERGTRSGKDQEIRNSPSTQTVGRTVQCW